MLGGCKANWRADSDDSEILAEEEGTVATNSASLLGLRPSVGGVVEGLGVPDTTCSLLDACKVICRAGFDGGVSMTEEGGTAATNSASLLDLRPSFGGVVDSLDVADTTCSLLDPCKVNCRADSDGGVSVAEEDGTATTNSASLLGLGPSGAGVVDSVGVADTTFSLNGMALANLLRLEWQADAGASDLPTTSLIASAVPPGSVDASSALVALPRSSTFLGVVTTLGPST